MWTKPPTFTVELRKARSGKRPAEPVAKQPAKSRAKAKAVIPGPIAREVAAALRTNRFPRHWFN